MCFFLNQICNRRSYVDKIVCFISPLRSLNKQNLSIYLRPTQVNKTILFKQQYLKLPKHKIVSVRVVNVSVCVVNDVFQLLPWPTETLLILLCVVLYHVGMTMICCIISESVIFIRVISDIIQILIQQALNFEFYGKIV